MPADDLAAPPPPPSRRSRWMRVFAIVAFLALIALGPLTEHTVPEKIFAATLVVCAALTLIFLTARLAFALLLAAVVFGTIEVASELKFTYLTNPLLAPDLIYFINLDTLTVISRYPVLLGATVATVLGVPFLLAIAYAADRRTLLDHRPRGVRIAVRVLGTCAAAAMLVATATPEGPFHDVYGKPMWITVNDRSFLTDFFTSFNDTQAFAPEIAPTDIDRTLNWKMERPMQAPPTRPDIVAILEESTFDPRILDACANEPLCRRPMFVPDAHTRANGYLMVHTFGGGTWTSEFALLTGLADVLFGNAGVYAPYNLAPRVEFSLPKALKASGYRIVAIYPTSGNFINARNAYDYYGFDAFYDGTDYGLGWESFDTDMFEVFKRVYKDEKEVHPDQPLFVFMLTLHQHGPHMTPYNEMPAPFDKPLFPNRLAAGDKELDDWLNLNLTNYLERLKRSDEMLADLERLLLGDAHPAVLLHFGDHQPSFDGAIHALKKKVPGVAGPGTNMITYFQVKSNFPIKRKLTYPVLDIVYLGGLVLDVAGVPKDAFYQANTLLRERCNGRYLDCKTPRVVASYHDYVFNQLHALHE